MRWPWQRKADAPPAAEIAEQKSKSAKVLQRARRLLSGATEDIGRAEQMIVDDYERVDQERREP